MDLFLLCTAMSDFPQLFNKCCSFVGEVWLSRHWRHSCLAETQHRTFFYMLAASGLKLMTRTKQIIAFFSSHWPKTVWGWPKPSNFQCPHPTQSTSKLQSNKRFISNKSKYKAFCFPGEWREEGEVLYYFLIKARSASKNRNLKTNTRKFFSKYQVKMFWLFFSFPSQKILMT